MTPHIFGVYHTYMDSSQNPNDQGEEAMAKQISQRRIDTEKEVRDILEAIIKKNLKSLSVDDKRFLQARRSLLTRGQLDEYSEILEEKLPRPDGQDEKEVELTRTELNDKARDLGIEDPDKLPNKDAVKEAIAEKEAEQKENQE